MLAGWTVFEVLVNMLQCGLIAYFGAKVFPPKPDYPHTARYVLPLWLLDSAIQSLYICVSFLHFMPNFIFSFAIALFFTGRYRRGAFASKLFWLAAYFVLFVSLTFVIRSIALSLSSITPAMLSARTEVRVMYVLTVNTLLVSMTLLLARIAGRSMGERLDRRVMVVSCLLIMTNLFVLLILLDFAALVQGTAEVGFAPVASALALLVVNALVLWLFQHSHRQNERVNRLNTENQHMEMQVSHLRETARIQDELRGWRHDTRSRLQALATFAAQGQYDALNQYLDNIVARFDSLPAQVLTGNEMMDIVINRGVSRAAAQHTDFTVDMLFAQALHIDDDDLLVLTDNLLENAFDACRRMPAGERRYVHIKGMLKKGHLSIQVENAMAPAPMKRGVFSMTSKKNENLHGIGNHAIDKIVDKYGGYIQREEKGQCYVTSLLLPNQQEEAHV